MSDLLAHARSLREDGTIDYATLTQISRLFSSQDITNLNRLPPRPSTATTRSKLPDVRRLSSFTTTSAHERMERPRNVAGPSRSFRRIIDSPSCPPALLLPRFWAVVDAALSIPHATGCPPLLNIPPHGPVGQVTSPLSSNMHIVDAFLSLWRLHSTSHTASTTALTVTAGLAIICSHHLPAPISGYTRAGLRLTDADAYADTLAASPLSPSSPRVGPHSVVPGGFAASLVQQRRVLDVTGRVATSTAPAAVLCGLLWASANAPRTLAPSSSAPLVAVANLTGATEITQYAILYTAAHTAAVVDTFASASVSPQSTHGWKTPPPAAPLPPTLGLSLLFVLDDLLARDAIVALTTTHGVRTCAHAPHHAAIFALTCAVAHFVVDDIIPRCRPGAAVGSLPADYHVVRLSSSRLPAAVRARASRWVRGVAAAWRRGRLAARSGAWTRGGVWDAIMPLAAALDSASVAAVGDATDTVAARAGMMSAPRGALFGRGPQREGQSALDASADRLAARKESLRRGTTGVELFVLDAVDDHPPAGGAPPAAVPAGPHHAQDVIRDPSPAAVRPSTAPHSRHRFMAPHHAVFTPPLVTPPRRPTRPQSGRRGLPARLGFVMPLRPAPSDAPCDDNYDPDDGPIRDAAAGPAAGVTSASPIVCATAAPCPRSRVRPPVDGPEGTPAVVDCEGNVSSRTPLNPSASAMRAPAWAPGMQRGASLPVPPVPRRGGYAPSCDDVARVGACAAALAYIASTMVLCGDHDCDCALCISTEPFAEQAPQLSAMSPGPSGPPDPDPCATRRPRQLALAGAMPRPQQAGGASFPVDTPTRRPHPMRPATAPSPPRAHRSPSAPAAPMPPTASPDEPSAGVYTSSFASTAHLQPLRASAQHEDVVDRVGAMLRTASALLDALDPAPSAHPLAASVANPSSGSSLSITERTAEIALPSRTCAQEATASRGLRTVPDSGSWTPRPPEMDRVAGRSDRPAIAIRGTLMAQAAALCAGDNADTSSSYPPASQTPRGHVSAPVDDLDPKLDPTSLPSRDPDGRDASPVSVSAGVRFVTVGGAHRRPRLTARTGAASSVMQGSTEVSPQLILGSDTDTPSRSSSLSDQRETRATSEQWDVPAMSRSFFSSSPTSPLRLIVMGSMQSPPNTTLAHVTAARDCLAAIADLF